MDNDLRPLTRALKELGFTSPLGAEDNRYMPRRDKLGERLANRLLAPTARMLLLAGPAGCGKSTELLHLQKQLQSEYAVFLCPCDRDLDLYRLEETTLYRYIIWRVLSLCQSNLAPRLSLTQEMVVEAQRRIGTTDLRMNRPSVFFATQRSPLESDIGSLTETLHRLLSEIERNLKPVLLLLDGLEKVPAEVSMVPHSFVRSPALADCQTVMVLPYWLLHGWESPSQWPGVEVLEVPIVSGISFVRDVVGRRAGGVFTQEALRLVANASGGVVRDGLQLAASAARLALDDGNHEVLDSHVKSAVNQMIATYKQVFSDDLQRARKFLEQVKESGELPADPELRTHMLASGAVLPGEGGSFFVHPMLVEL